MFRAVLVCVLAGGLAGSSPAAPAAADHVKDLLETDIESDERNRFFHAAGVDGELSSEEFKAVAGKEGSFVRASDRWKDAAGHDADGSGMLNWPEAQAFREAMRRRLLRRFDRNSDGKLTGAERQAANKELARGTLHPRWKVAPDAEAAKSDADEIIRTLPRDFHGIEFTDAQKSQIRVARERLAEKIDTGEWKGRWRLRQALAAEVRRKILTDAQRTDLALQPVLRNLAAAHLTDAQKAAIRARYAQMSKGKTRRQLGRVLRDLQDHVDKEVLKPPQRAALGVNRLLGQYGNARLTGPQRAKIALAYARGTQGVNLSDPKAAGEALKKIKARISKEILTDEQREAMKRKGGRRRGGRSPARH